MRHCMMKDDIMSGMSEINRNSLKIRILTAVFVLCVALLGSVCIGILNSKYDSLSRYPYTDQKSRELIKEYLTGRDRLYY